MTDTSRRGRGRPRLDTTREVVRINLRLPVSTVVDLDYLKHLLGEPDRCAVLRRIARERVRDELEKASILAKSNLDV